MDFSKALVECKTGSRITRSGWNGANQYVVLRDGFPNGIPISRDTARQTGVPEGTVCKFEPYLLMRNAQGSFVPWLASQGDLLANDWTLVI